MFRKDAYDYVTSPKSVCVGATGSQRSISFGIVIFTVNVLITVTK